MPVARGPGTPSWGALAPVQSFSFLLPLLPSLPSSEMDSISRAAWSPLPKIRSRWRARMGYPGELSVSMPFQPRSVPPLYPGVLCGPRLMPPRAGKPRQRQYLSPRAHSSISWLPLTWATNGILSLTLHTSSSPFYFVLNFQSLWRRSVILIPLCNS